MLPFILACAVFVLLQLVAERRRDGWGKRGAGVFKTAAVLSFLALAMAGRPASAADASVVVGLVLCGFGDLLLIKRGTGLLFRLGLLSFLFGHIAYVVSAFAFGVEPFAGGVALMVLLAPAALIGRWLFSSVPRSLRAPVVAYIAVITLMVAAMAGRAVVDSADGAVLVLSAVAFWFSDLFVARQRFVSAGYLNKILGLPLYFAAQLGFAASTWSDAATLL